jgi:hypothetical protein
MRNMLICLLLVFIYYGCEKDKSEINGEVVYLLSSADPFIFNKSVVLFDDLNYNIKTPFDTFILGYPFNVLGGYETMKAKAMHDSSYLDILNVSNYMNYQNDSIYTLAYYLENGNCLIIDKIRNVSINSIKVEAFCKGGPMTTTCGRRFYIRNNLLFETVDMTSK